ncbi:MAG TPA: SDR family oxidoreductase [Gemmatimonadales bacterium]|nr:SDR family oxidoreductase [Gemmatimonadales bacterium]
MRLAVFGATGRVGRRILEYAAREGHGLRALVRDPARLPAGLGGQVIAGDVSDPAAVRTTLEGCEAVLSALGGAGLANPGTAISGGMKTIVAEMKRAGINRVLAVGGSGVLDGPDGRLRSESPAFPKVFAAITREHIGTWEAFKASQLDWTMVCCPDILDGELTKRYRVSADVLPEGGSTISTEDVAWFMLQQVPLTPFVRRRVGIAY